MFVFPDRGALYNYSVERAYSTCQKLMDYNEHCASLSPVLSRLALSSVALAIQTATFWPGSLGAKLTADVIPSLTLPQTIGVVDPDF
jgi:hypothetical protein